MEGPRPKFARADGGEGGSHPSNVHDHVYAIGACVHAARLADTRCNDTVCRTGHGCFPGCFPHLSLLSQLPMLLLPPPPPAGSINYTGDMPIALMVDGPSLGGFVCPATITTTGAAAAAPPPLMRVLRKLLCFRQASWWHPPRSALHP